MEIVHYPVFKENPSNPARVNVLTGRMEINDQAMFLLPKYAQKFVIEHEKGHYHLQTFDEIAADNYALRQMALKKPNSLWNHIKSVNMVTRGDEQRKQAAKVEALKIAANNGSKEAEKLLKSYANATGTREKQTKILIIVGLIFITIILLWTLRK